MPDPRRRLPSAGRLASWSELRSTNEVPYRLAEPILTNLPGPCSPSGRDSSSSSLSACLPACLTACMFVVSRGLGIAVCPDFGVSASQAQPQVQFSLIHAPNSFCLADFNLSLFDPCMSARALQSPLVWPQWGYHQNPATAKDVMRSINVEIPHGIGFRFRDGFNNRTRNNTENHNHKALQSGSSLYSLADTKLIHPTMIVVFVRRTGYFGNRKIMQKEIHP